MFFKKNLKYYESLRDAANNTREIIAGDYSDCIICDLELIEYGYDNREAARFVVDYDPGDGNRKLIYAYHSFYGGGRLHFIDSLMHMLIICNPYADIEKIYGETNAELVETFKHLIGIKCNMNVKTSEVYPPSINLYI